MPPSDASETDLIKALRERAEMEGELPDWTAFMRIVHTEISMDLGGKNADKIINLETDFRTYLKRHGRKEHARPRGA